MNGYRKVIRACRFPFLAFWFVRAGHAMWQADRLERLGNRVDSINAYGDFLRFRYRVREILLSP